MLDRHLIAQTNPQANPHNIVLWKDYRITVLQDRLFRIEKSSNEKFRDKATQTVWFRNMPPQCFSVVKTQERLEIGTPYCSLLLSQNVPIQTVSKYMGHSDSTVTLKVYSHFIPDTQDTALNALNNISA